MRPQDKTIIHVYYDGYCHLCHWSLKFILRNKSAKAQLAFFPLQHYFARKNRNIQNLNSVIVAVQDDDGIRQYQESSAFLFLARHLKLPAKLLACCALLPRGIRDILYRQIAEHRYQLFGHSSCMLFPS